MTSDLTTREVSQRLKDVGFEAKTQHYYYKGVHGEITLRHDYLQAGSSVIETPAYSASTLFEWLRENKYDLSFYFDYEAQLRVDVGLSDDIEFRIEENYSLPDMLAEAIIWILTQEKENK